MGFAPPTLAVSAPVHLLAPNANISTCSLSPKLATTLYGMEQARLTNNHSALHIIPGYTLTEAARSLITISPTDVLFYTAPAGAYVWRSNLALWPHTRAAVSFTRRTSMIILDALRIPPDYFNLATSLEPASDTLVPGLPILSSPLGLCFNHLASKMSTLSTTAACRLEPQRSTILDGFALIHAPPPTPAIDSPTTSLNLSISPDVERRRIRLLYYVLFESIAFGQNCVLHSMITRSSDQPAAYLLNPIDSSGSNTNGPILLVNHFDLNDPRIEPYLLPTL
ncbi:hypothetical protein BDV93DRAFT_547284 [Ceratobasidium sp. AG-I]|nr:hypothetical protein BDV93DRAFT_547284 [Ceratobasidium sp. AG-I]